MISYDLEVMARPQGCRYPGNCDCMFDIARELCHSAISIDFSSRIEVLLLTADLLTPSYVPSPQVSEKSHKKVDLLSDPHSKDSRT